jgi:hypothetical protein
MHLDCGPFNSDPEGLSASLRPTSMSPVIRQKSKTFSRLHMHFYDFGITLQMPPTEGEAYSGDLFGSRCSMSHGDAQFKASRRYSL